MKNLSTLKKADAKTLNKALFPVLLTAALVGGTATAATTQMKTESVSQGWTQNALVNTEQAIALLRIDRDASLEKIESALASIEKIESKYAPVSEEAMVSPYSDERVVHSYPHVNLDKIAQDGMLPTLEYKLNPQITYQGSEMTEAMDANTAYFDFTLAKASLMTARDAIKVDHDLETLANLRRVFEAVYVNPEFEVAS